MTRALSRKASRKADADVASNIIQIIVKLLLAHGADPDQPDARGALPTDYALRGLPGCSPPGEGHANCYQLLLRHIAR